MQIGFIGLGKMGNNLCLNALDNGHDAVVFDLDREAVERLAAAGADGAPTIAGLADKLARPRVIWVMVPAGGPTEKVVQELASLLDAGDIVIEGGNSHYKDSMRRANELAAQGVRLLDAGTSGGVEGARNGICVMIGGDREAFETVAPLIHDISVDNGCLYAGPSGSGHFLKMIHNGIEYGMMQAIAEGFEMLEKSPFDYDYEQVARVWNNGSVIRSWLMELTENAFSKDPGMKKLKGVVHSSGEGQWTVETALELAAATPVIAMSLMMRYRSLEPDTFSGKVVAAMRNEFGGHSVVAATS